MSILKFALIFTHLAWSLDGAKLGPIHFGSISIQYPDATKLSSFNNSDSKLPSSLDWRQKGVILPVFNQGECAGSVVINALDAVSAFAAIHLPKPLTKLSRQQVYDCTGDPYYCSCEGSTKTVADLYFNLMTNNSGDIDSDASYPYTGTCGPCKFSKSGTAVQLTAYATNNVIKEELLQELLQYGPVTAIINASLMSFQMYTGGVYDDPQCSADLLDHVVLVVGYGTQNGEDYWIVRNSWGSEWGLEGYALIARNKNNLCGIASSLVIPWSVN